MLILVINCGSSSLKYTLFYGECERAAGLIEKIGETGSSYTCRAGEQRKTVAVGAVPDHTQAITLMMRQLREDRVIAGPQDIDAVGHRVVHGGPAYTDAARVDTKVRNNRIAKELAPLHRPNYVGIEACIKLMPKTPQVAVFDTAFHQTMPPKAYTYALPYRFTRDAHIRRYGFHGTSHKYVSQRAAQLIRRRSTRLITLHLGNGSSIAAVKNGRCQDTSMGLTPLAGVVMGSRCGDIDPAIVPYIMQREGLTPAQVEKLLNRESGILGISGVSNDLRDVIARAQRGHARSRLALDVFAYSIQKYVGAYWAVLGGADALVFTAGIGERSPYLRALICRGLAGVGVRLDAARNAAVVSQEGRISAGGSAVQVWVIPTREEAMIARETERIIRTASRRRSGKKT